MPTTIDLPGGQKATLRDVDELTVKQRRMVQACGLLAMRQATRVPTDVLERMRDRAILGDAADAVAAKDRLAVMLATLPSNKDEAMEVLSASDDAIVAFLEGWTLDRPLPKSTEELEDLPGPVFTALEQAIAPRVSEVVNGPSVDLSVKPPTEEFKDAPFVVSGRSNTRSTTRIRKSSRAM